MPTVFEKLESALQGGNLNSQLGSQAGALSSVTGALGGLISNPPSGIAGLGQALQSMPAPKLDFGGNFAGTLTSLKNAIPTDLGSVTGGLTSGIGALQTDVTEKIGGKLGEMIEAIKAIYDLTQLDFTGNAAASGGTGAGGAGGGAGAGAGAGAGGAGGAGAGAGAGGGQTPAQPPPSASAIDQAHTILAGLPSPLTVEGLLNSLQALLLNAKLDNLPVRQLLFVGELRDTLGTLFRWKAAQPSDIAAELKGTLDRLEAFLHTALDPVFQPLFDDAGNAASHLHATELSQIADGLVARLGEIQPAVAAGSLAGATASVTAASALLDQYDTLKPVLQSELLGGLPAIESRLATLADDLDDQLGRAVSVLTPSNSIAILDAIPAPPDTLPQPFVDLGNILQAMVRWFQDLFDKIDLSAVQSPLKTAADGARSAVDGLDNAMVSVTTQVQSLFGQVDSLLAQVDTAAIAAQAQSAINNFKDQIVQELTALFAPVKDALAQVVATIDQNVSAFDPSQIVTALNQAIDSVAGVLQDPSVLGAVHTIQDTLNQASDQIHSFSFAPVTDQVIAEINKVADELKQIDTSQLNPALQVALQGALQVIPHDLSPLTNPLIDEFNQLIQAGPVPLLDAVKDQPKKLLDQARHFQPAQLLGDQISKPYQQLLGQMNQFRPSQLLKPVDAELNSLKDRLKRNASPGLALKPLEGPFNDLLHGFDQLKPETVIQPLDDAIHKVVDTVLKVVPADAVFAQVDAVLDRVKQVVAIGNSFSGLLGKIKDLLDGLSGPQAQLDAWLSTILAKIDQIGDTAPLQASLAAASGDVARLQSAAVAARFSTGAAALQSALTTLDPQGRLTAVIQAWRAIPAASVDALPNSPSKSSLKTMLARLDPMQPAFQAPYLAIEKLRQSMAQASSALAAGLGDWDTRYHAPDEPLAGLLNLSPTPANVRQWIHDAAEEQVVRPLGALLAMASPAANALEPIAAQLQTLMTALTGKLNDLLLGPNSLGGIRDALQALVDRLKNFNLGFLRDSLKDLFAEVRGKLDAFNPARLADTLDKAFGDMLDTLSLSTILPAAEVATLDGDYTKIIDKLKQLDPGKIVVEAVQPQFEQKVLPLLDAFDITPVLNALVDALHKLGDQLKSELDRVNQAFQAMLDSVPSMSASDVVGAVAGGLADAVGFSL